MCSSAHPYLQTGFTALIVASQEGHSGVVRMLLEAKADINWNTNVSESCSSDDVCTLAESFVCAMSNEYKETKIYSPNHSHSFSHKEFAMLRILNNAHQR